MGVSACGRVGVWACQRGNRRLAEGWLDYPPVRLIDHFDNLGYDFVTLVIEFFEGLAVDVLVVKADLEMDLRFACLGLCVVELGYKRRLVPPLSPGFSQIRADGTARSPDLIG